MEFVVDKENRRVKITKEFDAPRLNVWAAWTWSELLDQWWAPKPWKTKTKTMRFKEGGYWLYAMVGPKGEEHWCRADFKSVTELKSFKALDAFCDEKGNIKSEMPKSGWECTFSEAGKKTIVTVEVECETIADLEQYIEMGFQEGFTSALENLDELLPEVNVKEN